MKISQHPEYIAYAKDEEIYRQYKLSVKYWCESGEPLLVNAGSLRWTYLGAKDLQSPMFS